MLLSPAPMLTTRSFRPAGLALLLFLSPVAWAQAPPADRPESFDRQLRLLFRMVACAGTETVPKELEAVVAEHCAQFEKTMEEYRRKYVAEAQPFLLGLQPKGLPSTADRKSVV